MGKQSKPNQSKPLEQPTQLTPDERANACVLALDEACKQLQCTRIFAQRTIDGQIVPLKTTDIVLVFVPNENIKRNGSES